MSYYSFASAVVNHGLSFALKCAVTYKTPIEQTLQYVRRFAVEGYVV